MVQVFYDIVIWLTNVLFRCVALFHPKAAKIIAGRIRTQQVLADYPSEIVPFYWFHCASLGEWEQTIPVVEAIKKKDNCKILLSFFSPSGFENAKRNDLIDLKIYLPADTAHGYDFIFEKFKFKAIVFTRYDLWPNFIKSAVLNQVPLFLIGAEFNANSRYLNPTSFFGKLLLKFNHISCNDQSSYELLIHADYKNVSADGSPKIERAFDLASAPEANELLSKWKGNYKVLIVGSAWQPEIDLISHFVAEKHGNNLRYIIVPHEPSPLYLDLLKKRFGQKMVLYSELTPDLFGRNIIVVDSIGHLSKMYFYADIALIGGGFGKGIHNILEPATYGIPVLSGMNYGKFSEATILLDLNIFYPVKDYAHFKMTLEQILNEDKLKTNIKASVGKLRESNAGVSERISDYIIKDSSFIS